MNLIPQVKGDRMSRTKKYIKDYFSNGGKKELFYLSVIFSLVLFLCRTSSTFGEYKTRFHEVEKRSLEIVVIQQDIAVIKSIVERMEVRENNRNRVK
jgi:hypothetical protein